MHNSGTSLLGNLMHGAGVPMGPSLLLRDNIPKDRRPRYDYFEDSEIVELHDHELLEIRRHWSSYRASLSLPPRNHPGRIAFRDHLAKLLPTRFSNNKLWLVKDPRSAVLVEDWIEVLNSLNIDTRLLIVHRDPWNNIRSFSSKGQVPELWAEALWQRTYFNALQAAKKQTSEKVVTTSFDDLLSEPIKEVQRLCKTLDWRLDRKSLEKIEGRINFNLPTESNRQLDSKGKNESQKPLHPSTTALQTQLKGEYDELRLQLLADELERTTTSQEQGLQLNEIRLQEQSLLPKVKVTIVTSELQGWGRSGGIGSAYRELASALATSGHCIRVVLVQSGPIKGEKIGANIEVSHVDSSGESRLSLVRKIARSLKQQRTDVVHLHDWLGFASGLKEALGPEGPQLIVGIHGPSAWARSANKWPITSDGGLLASEAQLFDEGVVQALELDGLKQADWLISPSISLKNWVIQNMLTTEQRALILVNRNCPLPQRLKHNENTLTNDNTGTNCAYFGRLEKGKV